MNLVPADDADLGRVGEGILEAVSQPVGHAVAEDHHRRRRRDLIGFRVQLARDRRARIIGRRLLLNIAVVLPPVGRAEQLLEKPVAARRALAAQERIILRHGRAAALKQFDLQRYQALGQQVGRDGPQIQHLTGVQRAEAVDQIA